MAQLLGREKRIVSFAVFGTDPKYTVGALENARLLETVYPGWVGRFYASEDVPKDILQELQSFPHVEVVVFSPLEWPGRSPATLRFSPAGETGIEAMVVRDTDSRLNPREAAAVLEWLADPSAKFHVMHESMHDVAFGEVMGGMWGCRRCADDPPSSSSCPGMSVALAHWQRDTPKEERESYGADMRFLAALLVPMLSRESCVHHVDGAPRPLGRLDGNTSPRAFPATDFRGFVGQPINCPCPSELFGSTGCQHCSRSVPSALSSRLQSKPDILASLSGFLG